MQLNVLTRWPFFINSYLNTSLFIRGLLVLYNLLLLKMFQKLNAKSYGTNCVLKGEIKQGFDFESPMVLNPAAEGAVGAPSRLIAFNAINQKHK